MDEERRAAPRVTLPVALEAAVSDVPVRVLELSTIGARIEHDQRFPLPSPQLRLRWEGRTAALRMRVIRTQIVGQRQSRLIYETGIEFISVEEDAGRVIAAILGDAENREQPAAPAAERPAPPQPMDDSWTRDVQFLRSDVGDDLPYAQFRLLDSRWIKEYVASPDQPEDGFTIPRLQTDFAELQRTFECADPETRRMMRIALQSQLTRS